MTYNPAALARLEGTQVPAGLDFNNADDEYISAAGSFSLLSRWPAGPY